MQSHQVTQERGLIKTVAGRVVQTPDSSDTLVIQVKFGFIKAVMWVSFCGLRVI